MDNKTWPPLAVAALAILALAFVAVPRSGSSQAAKITVNGQASVQVKPDTAHVTLGIQTQGTTPTAAQSQNDATMKKIQAAVEKLGIAASAISTQGYNLMPVYAPRGGKVTGYRVTDSVDVTVKKLSLVGRIMSAATAAGANRVNGVSWMVSDPATVQQQAYLKALQNARAAAGKLASNLHMTITGVDSIDTVSQNSPIRFAPVAMSSAAASAAPVQPGLQKVSVTLKVVFRMR